MRIQLTSFVVMALWAGTANAQEADAPQRKATFGSRGQVVLDDLLSLRLTSNPSYGGSIVTYGGLLGYARHQSDSSSGSSALSHFWISPSADWFVAERFSIGGTVNYSRFALEAASGGRKVEQEGEGLTVTPRFGYVFPLGSRVALWPRVSLGVGYSEISYSDRGPGQPADSLRDTTWLTGAELGFVFRFGMHGFLNVSPSVRYYRTNGTRGASETSGDGVLLGASAHLGLVF
jgi:hypothetical protein